MRRALFSVAFCLIAAGVMAEELFIPMVAQKQGLDGAWWNTEVWIANPTSATGSYGVVFLPAGQANGDVLRAEPNMEDLGPGATFFSSELVPEGQVGVLRVVTSRGLAVFARVFNAAGRGSFGEGMPAQPKSAAFRPGEIAQLLGLRRTPQYRTNISMFNPSSEPGVIRIRIYQQNGELAGEESYRFGPGGYIQLTDVLHAFGVTRGEHLRAEVSGTVPLFTFASVVDSRSSAPTLVIPTR